MQINIPRLKVIGKVYVISGVMNTSDKYGVEDSIEVEKGMLLLKLHASPQQI